MAEPEPRPGVEVRLPTNMLTPYARVHLSLGPGTITAAWWLMALGVLPIRRRRLALPLERVSSLRIRGALFPARLTAAGGLAAVLWLAPLPAWGSVLVGAAAGALLLLGYVAALEVTHEGGRVLVPICFWQRRRAARWVEAVAARLAGRRGA